PDPPAFPGVVLNAPVSMNLDGGAGDDDLRVIFAGDPPPGDRPNEGSPPTGDRPALEINAPLTLNVDGGAGNDVIVASLDDVFVANARGQVAVDLNGDAGEDRIGFRFQGRLDGDFRLRIDGGNGNDQVAAGFLIDAASMGTLDAAVLGGRGNDMLALDVYFASADGTMTGNGHGRL